MTNPLRSRNGTPVADGSAPLNIQFFVNFVHRGGTYFRFHNLAVGLTQLGHRVTVFAGDHDYRTRPRKEVRDGVPYHITPESLLTRVFGQNCDPLTAAQRFARRYPPCDVVHLFQPFSAATAAWIRASGRVRFYDWDDLWTGGLIPESARPWRYLWRDWIVRLLESQLPKRADHVTAVSGFLANRAWEANALNVSVIYNGFWPVRHPDRASARRQIGLRDNALYAGFMGRTADELPWCFNALAENLNRHPTLRLAVCGAPPSLIQSLSPTLRERVDYLGQLTPEQTRSFAAALDLGLLPLADNTFNRSRFPIKFSEHMSTGIPLLCSTIGECGGLATQYRWAVPAGTTLVDWLTAFRGAIDRIAANPAETLALPHELERLQSEMSWGMMSHQLVAAYRAALSGRMRTSSSAKHPSL